MRFTKSTKELFSSTMARPKVFLKSAVLAGGASLLAAGCATSASPSLAPATPAPPERPNIIFVLVDDMGWVDSGVYGSEYYQTPHIDRFAEMGVRFTNAYVANPLCSPTRASIMTGKYPARLQITAPAAHLAPEPPPPLYNDSAAAWQPAIQANTARYMDLEEYTIGEAFRDAGYQTVFMGKWHLGQEPWWPDKQGFEVNIGGTHFPGPPSFFSPYHNPILEDGPEGEYLTDRMAMDTRQVIADAAADDRPLFFCYWHWGVHAPFQGKQDLIEKYEGITDPRGKQDCPVMGAMLESVDDAMGDMLDTLEQYGMMENTIIIFTSDNGGNMYDDVGGTTATNNYPLRNGKGNNYEGGSRVPAIVYWPGVTPENAVSDAVISTVDYYPTLLSMAGLPMPEGITVDGIDITPVYYDPDADLPREAIFSHFPHYVMATQNIANTWVRRGDWKLLRFWWDSEDGQSHRLELYDLSVDIGESNNLAAVYPELAAELDKLIDQHLEEIGVAPLPRNPAFRPGSFNPMLDEPIDGWVPGGTSSFAIGGGTMIVESTGEDPFVIYSGDLGHNGPVVARVRMKSDTGDYGQLFWVTRQARAHAAGRSVTFDMVHDNAYREYRVELPVSGDLTGIRLDPGRAEGTIEIDWIRLETPGGELVKEWTFDD